MAALEITRFTENEFGLNGRLRGRGSAAGSADRDLGDARVF